MEGTAFVGRLLFLCRMVLGSSWEISRPPRCGAPAGLQAAALVRAPGPCRGLAARRAVSSETRMCFTVLQGGSLSILFWLLRTKHGNQLLHFCEAGRWALDAPGRALPGRQSQALRPTSTGPFRSFRALISYTSVLEVSVCKSFTLLVKFIPKHSILLGAIVNGIIFLISFSDCS